MDSIEHNFKTETKTIKFLLKAFFFFIHLAIMTEIVAGPKFRLGLRLAFFLYLSTPYYKTIKHRYYTYWSFSAILFVYMLFKINEQFFVQHHFHIGILYLISTLILILKMYILSSPIYYPRVSWWEYDFRYRDDLKITVKVLEAEYVARLTDLRRLAGCVALFEELKLGDEIILHTKVDDVSVTLRGQIMSKRRDLIGRPLIYGVQFKFDSRSNKKRYIQLFRLWKKDKHSKRKLKFAHV
ncbi:MAG: hypothetical protein Q7U04_16300 [Bacteriovorax sp.]|nr:hypothetical protein [Bacteriovorax sp.]